MLLRFKFLISTIPVPSCIHSSQVLMQQEFGGSLSLNTTWAKSMLRRLGIRSRGKEAEGAQQLTQ